MRPPTPPSAPLGWGLLALALITAHPAVASPVHASRTAAPILFAHITVAPPATAPDTHAGGAPRHAFSADLPMRTAPSGHAIVHFPEGFDPTRPVHLVFFFHGSGVCVGQFLGQRAQCGASLQYGPGCGGPDRFDPIGANAILVIPQLHFGATDTLNRRGGLRALVDELLHETLPRAAGLPRLDVERLDGVTLIAHSAGHRALERGLADPALSPYVRNIALFDTAPVGVETHRRWLSSGSGRHRITVLHTTWAAARNEAHALVDMARRVAGVRAIVTDAAHAIPAMDTHDVVAAFAPFEHGWLPWLYFPKVLGALGLPRRTDAGQASRDPESTPRDTISPAPIAFGPTVAGELTRGDPVTDDGSAMDAYAVRVAAGQHLTVEVSGLRSWTDRAIPLDVIAFVYDDDREIARDDDSLGHLGARLEFTAPHAGVYTVRVSTFGTGLREGGYRLSIR